MRFTIATYNIHKGFTQFSRRMVIHEVRERLHGLSADILFLQEVLGTHDRHQHRYREWPGKSQHEFIADAKWREVAYGKNAVYRDGHHGNAVLSRFPIIGQENCDISAHLFESRGLFIARSSRRAQPVLHCLNVPRFVRGGRQRQITARIRTTVPKGAADHRRRFNDWRSKGTALTDALGLTEVFEEVKGRPGGRFPRCCRCSGSIASTRAAFASSTPASTTTGQPH